MKEFYRGDSVLLNYQILQDDGTPFDLTNWQIRAELTDTQKQVRIKKASSNVPGGSESQIKIVNAVNGEIQVRIESSETQNLIPNTIYNFEVEITNLSQGLKYTVVRDQFMVLEDIIDWTNK
jgi:uncharacterized membrane-anchored protein